MAEGIHTVVEICRPDACDVADLSREVTVSRVTRAGTLSADGTVAQEVTIEEAADDDDLPDAADLVFEYDGRTVLRLQRPHGQDCPCELIERHDCPVRSVDVEQGTVRLSFIAADIETVRAVIEDLRRTFGNVHVTRLTQSSPSDEGDGELLVLDGMALTDRQREVLETAHEMGYFAYPKEANAGEVAAELDVTTATVVEHLSAAQSKLLDAIFDA